MKRIGLIAALVVGFTVSASPATAATQPDGRWWSVAPELNRGAALAPDWGRTPPRLPDRVRRNGGKFGP